MEELSLLSGYRAWLNTEGAPSYVGLLEATAYLGLAALSSGRTDVISRAAAAFQERVGEMLMLACLMDMETLDWPCPECRRLHRDSCADGAECLSVGCAVVVWADAGVAPAEACSCDAGDGQACRASCSSRPRRAGLGTCTQCGAWWSAAELAGWSERCLEMLTGDSARWERERTGIAAAARRARAEHSDIAADWILHERLGRMHRRLRTGEWWSRHASSSARERWEKDRARLIARAA
ncbi:hypothetical protein DWB68_06240 [Galactobacter valiniphilus]|uniref:Uncharacterized protein n=1 Tax=Galactobacter valiniphilus TaxID=2676122 RepID=A0A399JJA8_9MICC|nr:hypothetical protein DWB68_06240 [Galactobacter valiniphilus]